MESEAFDLFRASFSDIIEAIVQMIRFGAFSSRDFGSFILDQPLLLALFLVFAVGLGIGLLRRLKSL